MLTIASAGRTERTRRSVGRVAAERLDRDILLARSEYLPPADRMLLVAHFVHGMTLGELAALHRSSKRQIRRRLQAIRDTLADPSFLLAVRFAKKLPDDLPALARGRWIESASLRTLARRRSESLHKIRQQLAHARSLMLFLASTFPSRLENSPRRHGDTEEDL